jgi:hypothetical protein
MTKHFITVNAAGSSVERSGDVIAGFNNVQVPTDPEGRRAAAEKAFDLLSTEQQEKYMEVARKAMEASPGVGMVYQVLADLGEPIDDKTLKEAFMNFLESRCKEGQQTHPEGGQIFRLGY